MYVLQCKQYINDRIGHFDVHTTANYMWDALRAVFTGTSMTKLYQLQMHFNSYNMNSKHSITEHLRKIQQQCVILMLPAMFLLRSSKYELYYSLYPKIGNNEAYYDAQLDILHSLSCLTF